VRRWVEVEVEVGVRGWLVGREGFVLSLLREEEEEGVTGESEWEDEEEEDDGGE